MGEFSYNVESGFTKEQSLTVNFNKGTVKSSINVFEIIDHGHTILYIPALDMSGYGDNRQEANEMLIDSVSEYFQTLVKLPDYTITEELNKYGWQRSVFFKKKFQNSTYIDKKGILQNFNLPEDTPVTETILTTA